MEIIALRFKTISPSKGPFNRFKSRFIFSVHIHICCRVLKTWKEFPCVATIVENDRRGHYSARD